MKIWTEPKVYVVGDSRINSIEIFSFLEDENLRWESYGASCGELLAETAGRLCYMSFGKGRKTNKEYLQHILESGHGSVLEHASVSMIFTGVSRSLTHELIRHRAGMAYSQLSQRYVDESDVGFVRPPDLPKKLHPFFEARCEEALKTYRECLNALRAPPEMSVTESVKWCRQQARAFLPNCTETKIMVTGNMRAWRNFIEQRGSVHADAEIRRLAIAVARILQERYPNLFGDYEITDAGVNTKWKKV